MSEPIGGIPAHMYFRDIPRIPIIPLEHIKQATNNFAQENIIEKKSDDTWMVYKGELSGKKLAFISIRRYYINSLDLNVLNELTTHKNIVSIFGSCEEHITDRILLLELPTRGGLDKYVSSTEHLTWLTRLKICRDIASGLTHYLQNHPKELDFYHECLTSASIHLDENWQAKIQLITPGALASAPSTSLRLGKLGYVDPLYMQTGRQQSEIYSFGVILFELLCARPAVTYDEEGGEQFLSKLARSHYEKGTLTELIDPLLRVQMNTDSVAIYSEAAYRCLSEYASERPTISVVIEQLQKVLKLQQGFVTSEFQQSIGSEPFSLAEIKSATNHFSKERLIGIGRSGKIYKGELSFSKKSIPVAVKRLDRAHSYEEGAFLKEVVKLSLYVHENIITLRGFCEEDDEKIIIMDHASNESLDRHLDKSILTWGIRLKISIGAAKGLNHIHSFEEDRNTVHGDIKSNHILLDHDWKASICDFIVSKSHGTLGYLDPQYSSSGATKASDVYSFGVVLFELLSGRRAIEKVEKYSHPTLCQIIDEEDGVKDVFLAWMAARCFEENKLDALIFDDLMEQTDAKSIDVVSEVAYECLQKDQAKRPTMGSVIKELEKALNTHEYWEFEQKLPKDNENIMKMIKHWKSEEITKKDLYPIFSSGIRLNNGKVLLSLNKDGKAKEMISATMFSYENCWSSKLKAVENSRFGTAAKISDTSNFKIQIKIKTQFLSLGIIYGAYLVFKFSDKTTVSSEPRVKLEYSIASEDLNSYVAVRRDDGWMMIELCRFRNHNQITEFKVQLERFWGHPCGIGPIFVDGIEFQPIDNVDHEESVDRLINADLSVKWDQQLSSDFREIMMRSEYDVPTMTEQELDNLLSIGVLIDNGEKLFSLSKVNRKKCHMLPAKAVISKSPDAKFTKCPSSTMSRFEEVVELQRHQAFSIKCDIETKMLSPNTAYACYLVFQLPENCEGLKFPTRITKKTRDLLNKNNKEDTIIYLRAPGPIDLYRDKRVPENREDGWMEVRVWKFVYNNETKDNYIPMELKLVSLGGTMAGLTVCGIEFRPL